MQVAALFVLAPVAPKGRSVRLLTYCMPGTSPGLSLLR